MLRIERAETASAACTVFHFLRSSPCAESEWRVAPEGGFQNVTEWCKKEICWNRARDSHIPFVTDLAPELIGRDEEQLTKKDAQTQQSVMTSIQIQTMVVELGPAYWQALRAWGRQRQLLSPDEDSIVSVGGAMPRKLPNEKQCRRLAEIRKRLEDEGFQYS